MSTLEGMGSLDVCSEIKRTRSVGARHAMHAAQEVKPIVVRGWLTSSVRMADYEERLVAEARVRLERGDVELHRGMAMFGIEVL